MVHIYYIYTYIYYCDYYYYYDYHYYYIYIIYINRSYIEYILALVDNTYYIYNVVAVSRRCVRKRG